MIRLTLVIILVLASVSAWASLDGSVVLLANPIGLIDGNTYYTFAFWVDNGSYSSEYIRTVTITFPYGLAAYYSWTMGFDEIVAGRPDFNMSVSITECTWSDAYSGGVHMLEDTFIWVDGTTFPSIPQGAVGYIHWRLDGNWGDTVEGDIQFFTPVEASSWGSIKAMYR